MKLLVCNKLSSRFYVCKNTWNWCWNVSYVCEKTLESVLICLLRTWKYLFIGVEMLVTYVKIPWNRCWISYVCENILKSVMVCLHGQLHFALSVLTSS